MLKIGVKKTVASLAMLTVMRAVAALQPLPEFRHVPHIDATECRKGDLSIVTIAAYDREGRLSETATNEVCVTSIGNTPCHVLGVGAVGTAVADLVRTNVVRLTKGRAIVAVKRPPMTDRTILRLRLQPLGEGLLGQDFWLRKVEDVRGV